MQLSKLTFKTERVNLEQGDGLGKYYFARAEYEKKMAQVYNAARLEKTNINATKKTFFIKMEIESAFSIFWDDDDLCIGDDSEVSLGKNKNINFNIPGFYDWANNYMYNALIPCEAGEISIEELNKTFDWKDFHKQGIAIAVEVKKLLPKNVVLKYVAPFEDQSGLLPAEVLIDSDRWYVENVLEKIV